MAIKLKSTIYQPKKGRHKGKWTLEIRGVDDETGELKCSVSRRYATKQEAKDNKGAEEKKLRDTDGQIVTGDKMTFSDLCRIAEEDILAPAVVRGGETRKGLRSGSTPYLMATLEAYFGKLKIRNIKAARIVDYGIHRFDVGKVTYSSINRELGVLRKMLKFACAEGWLTTDIFRNAAMARRPLIKKKDSNNPRDQMLKDTEEEVLLACTHGTRQIAYKWKRKGVERVVETTIERCNEELLPIILVALDSGMRKGEILETEWSHVDFDGRFITIPAENTKALEMRRVPISKRVAEALRKLPTYGETERVFRTRYLQRSWTTATRIAGLDDLQLRDLRRTFAKRLEEMGVAFTVLQKIMGHASQSVTGNHYLPATVEDVQRVADLIDARNEGRRGRFSALDVSKADVGIAVQGFLPS